MIKKILKNWLMPFILPRPLVGFFYLPRLFIHWVRFSHMYGAPKIRFADLQPCLSDWTFCTPFDPHYFYQGAWLARKIAKVKTDQHIDVGSSVLTISVLSGFVKTTFVDYRPLKSSLENLNSITGNILALSFDDKSIQSLSCLHVIEHIGLGRYGDPLDPSGSIKAAKELQRVLAVKGNLYISVPVGRERIAFNAHRIFSPKKFILMFPELQLIDFSYVDDAGQFHRKAKVKDAMSLEYGCGMFHFIKSK